MKVDGQAENLLLEEVASAAPSPSVRSRIYSDISDTSNPLIRYYESTRWAQVRLRKERIQQGLTGNTILTAIDENVTCDGSVGAFAVTLPAASVMPGESIYIQKLDTTFNKITVTAAGADNIDGASTQPLTSYGEWTRLMSTGTGWITLDWGYYEGRVAFTPTGSMTTNTTWTGFWQRTGNCISIDALASFSGAPDSVNLTITLPVAIKTSELLNTSATSGVLPGSGTIWDNSATTHYYVSLLYGSNTTARVVYDNSGTTGPITQASPITIATADKVWVTIPRLPVSGWRGFWAV